MPDASIQKAYQWAVEKCNADNIGYSQTYRNQQTVNGITYYDCSSFINYALLAGGFITTSYAPNHNAFTTYAEGNVLLQLGFTEVTNGSLKAGDIGVTNSGGVNHTEMIYEVNENGAQAKWMGAHSPDVPLADQVSITDTWVTGKRFDFLYRYQEGTVPGLGVSLYVVAAIAGNFWIESSINPGIWENLQEGTWTDLLKGYGLGQWTNTGSNTEGRLYQLHKWLSKNGYADDSGDGQVQYIIEENYWTPKEGYEKYATLTDFMQSDSTDITELTHYWNYCWEGIYNSTWNTRVDRAKDCYNYILQHKDDTAITAWITGNRFLSVNERYNNAVMLYRILSTDSGDKPYVKARKGLKIWQMIRNPRLYIGR